jgi:threonine 3-dehydrogenase
MQAPGKSKREPGLWLEEVAVPESGIDDALIRVTRNGICGDDFGELR